MPRADTDSDRAPERLSNLDPAPRSIRPVLAAMTTDHTKRREQCRVLMVTDAPVMADFGASFQKAGYDVVGVTGGTAALVSLRRSRPHVVVIAGGLRGIGADALARLLMKAPGDIPFVMAGTDPSTVERRLAAMCGGASDYFQVPGELGLLVARVGQLAAATQAMDRLRVEAAHDYLTGLANRRRFRAVLGQEVERWRRYSVPCSLLLSDIDYLKRINDAHGHSAGDEAIRHLASALREHSRDNDTAARLGGEEFALLLAGVDDRGAGIAAERLRESVMAEPLEGIGLVTISLGVAACPAHADSERALYAAADAALYRAKNEGRNRVVMANGT